MVAGADLSQLRGVVYQPRGAWLKITGNGSTTMPMQVITGGLRMQGGPNLTLLPSPLGTLTRSVATLVE